MKAPSLLADFQNVDGDVRWPRNWKELSPVTRADLLADWIAILCKECDEAINELVEPQTYRSPVNGG
jgi:hypothetical protein